MRNKYSDTTNNDWLDAQRQYLDTWTAIGKFFSDSINRNQRPDNPMAESMEQWWKLIAPTLPQGSNDFISKISDQGKMFFFMGEQFTTLLNNINDLNKISGDWLSALNTQFEEIKKILTSSINTNHTMHDIFGAWQLLPMDTLQRTFSSASVMPGDFFEDLKPENLQNVTDRFLSIPGVGYTRESQEQIQGGIKLWADYQKAYGEYNNNMYKVAVNALDAMRLKIIQMSEQGHEINSLREIYDLWVDCNEEAYAEFAFSEEFSELYGRLTNTLMAVKQHGRNVVDEGLSAMNMPTRRGINTMQKRQQEMRREQKATFNIIENLQQEIVTLREQLSGKDKPAPAKSSSRKKRNTGKITSKVTGKSVPIKRTKKKKTGIKTRAKKVSRTSKNRSKRDDVVVIKI
jgi:polyhydroxyalkanoate synthase subunit PhaE